MIQAGGWLVSKDGKTATVNSKANLQAFSFVKSMISNGSMKLTNQLGAGWGGEGFGKKECAMTIEGNWISGAMSHDYPTVPWVVAQLPAGPAGQGTLQYDGGWGLANASKNKAAAMQAIAYLTATKVEMGNARAFGVMPSVKADRKEWTAAYPKFAPFLAGADYSRSIPTVPNIATVLGDFNQQLQGLPTTNPKTILNRINSELQSVLNQQ
jgi:multiple sugar transport system substrate-binding protein